MISLLKNFGKGILYIIALPFFLVIISVYAVFGILMFFYMIFKSIILFFTGRNLFDDLPEDKKAKAILHPNIINNEPINNADEEPHFEDEPEQDENVSNENEVHPQYIPPIYPSVFTPNYVETTEQTPENEAEIQEEIQTEEQESETIEDEEIIEKYEPKTPIYDDLFSDDSDDNKPGVIVERNEE